MSSVEYVRFYVGPDGRSCLQRGLSIEMRAKDFVPPSPPIEASPVEPALGCTFLNVPRGYDGGWHPSPARMWLFFISGQMRMEAGDGQAIVAGPGSVVLLEDTSGRGHYSRVDGELSASMAAVHLPV
jgi:hypothetical protein